MPAARDSMGGERSCDLEPAALVPDVPAARSGTRAALIPGGALNRRTERLVTSSLAGLCTLAAIVILVRPGTLSSEIQAGLLVLSSMLSGALICYAVELAVANGLERAMGLEEPAQQTPQPERPKSRYPNPRRYRR